MEYTVQRLAKLAGISSRTLRYYDEIGLLKPNKINSSGYRIYGKAEVDKLQQILFYRELGMKLDDIKELINSPYFDEVKALKGHREKLLIKRKRLDVLISNVDKTIADKEGRANMSDKEKFQGFKKKLIDENERKYGREIRGKYGRDAVEKNNQKFMEMTQEQYDEVNRLNEELMSVLSQAVEEGDPAGETAQKAADLHKKWLTYYWPEYSKEAHAGLAEMYVEDDRFKAYYDDKIKPGTAEFLKDAIFIYTGLDDCK